MAHVQALDRGVVARAWRSPVGLAGAWPFVAERWSQLVDRLRNANPGGWVLGALIALPGVALVVAYLATAAVVSSVLGVVWVASRAGRAIQRGAGGTATGPKINYGT